MIALGRAPASIITPLLLVVLLHPLQTTGRAGSAAGWNTLTKQIETALGAELQDCPNDNRGIEVAETGEISIDRIPIALVEYCHMGAYTSDVAVLRLQRGAPVVVKFRDTKGRVIAPGFLSGASVRNGEATDLLAAKDAVYATHWQTDESGELQTCKIEAYVWNAQTATFDESERLRNELAETHCGTLRQQFHRQVENDRKSNPLDPR